MGRLRICAAPWKNPKNQNKRRICLSLTGVTCSCGWMGPTFNTTAPAASLSILMWFVRDGVALGFQMATATLQSQGALGHALLPRAGEPCSSQSPPLQSKVVLLLELSQICSTVHSHQMVHQCPGLYRYQWSLQEAGLFRSKEKERGSVSKEC